MQKKDDFLSHYDKIDENSIIFEFLNLFYMVKSDAAHEENDIKQRQQERGSSNFISSMVDAALYFQDATIFASDEIKNYIEKDRVLPYKLLYKTDEGARIWLELCKSPKYTFYTKSFNNLRGEKNEIVQKIVNTANRTDFDLVSLGVGDGEKDSLLIAEFLKKAKADGDVYYYPMDTNDVMIETTAKKLSTTEDIRKNLDKLRIKPFIGDFLGIDKMDLFYNYRKSPNIFSVLGNTIGNYNELGMIQTLQGAVEPGDYVLFEINTDQSFGEKKKEFVKSKENRRHDLAPLKSVGMRYSEKDLKYQFVDPETNTYTVVEGTVSVLAECLVAENGGPKKKVKLSVVHYYNFEQFVEHMQKKLNMKVLYQKDKDGVGLVLLHRELPAAA